MVESKQPPDGDDTKASLREILTELTSVKSLLKEREAPNGSVNPCQEKDIVKGDQKVK